MDTQTQGVSHGWTSLDSPGYPWCKWTLRHRVLVMGGHPRMVRGILGVNGYSDTGIGSCGHPCIVQGVLGVVSTQIQGLGHVDILG